MQHHIERITSSFAEKLPEDKIYFEPADLRELSYPEFFVKRVEKELRRNLDDSVIIPETEWADMESPQVHESWDNFLQAIQSVVRMPRSFAHTVFESAVADILEQLVQPRKQMVEALFGTKSYLTIEQLEAHANYITVYSFLPLALIRYMRKREIEEIDRKRAAQIIAMVDEKVTTRYTPLNWAQLIEPWFILMGPELDSELLRQFFQDKELFNLAEHFDEENKLINRTNFIEILSRPDFDIADLENAEEYQKSHPPKHKRVKEEDGEKSSDSDSHPDPKPIQKDPNIRRFQLEQELDSEESDTRLKREGLQNKSAESLQNEQKRPSERKEESYGKKKKELEIPSDEGSSHKDGISKSKKNSSFEDELDRLSKQSTRHATPSEEPFSFDDDNGGDDEDESDSLLDQYSDKGENDKGYNHISEVPGYAGEETDEEIPMWQHLSGDSEHDEDDDFDEEPIIDLSGDKDDNEFSEREYKRLNAHLDLHEEAFIDEIFGGDQNIYVDIKQHLSKCDTWKGEATEIIKNEVFGRNSIDPTTEIALDFVDAVQSYFLEKQKRNKE
jgi:hypothetical protein